LQSSSGGGWTPSAGVLGKKDFSMFGLIALVASVLVLVASVLMLVSILLGE
jgi:hypothetical protein